VVAARKLTTRSGRSAAGRFLAEGAQAVREALARAAGRDRPAAVHELFVTEQAASRHADLVRQARAAGVRVSTVTPRAAELLSETVTPQGLVAVCDTVDVTVAEAIGDSPRMVAVLVGVSDPGNAGTVVRVADAAGADAVVLAGDSVDPHNGKCVRASTGSLFHLPVARERDVADVMTVRQRSARPGTRGDPGRRRRRGRADLRRRGEPEPGHSGSRLPVRDRSRAALAEQPTVT